MVTAAFTIFFGVELFFIRILVTTGTLGRCDDWRARATLGETLTFCALHNTLLALHKRPGQGLFNGNRQGNA
jgi:hypothetical protein